MASSTAASSADGGEGRVGGFPVANNPAIATPILAATHVIPPDDDEKKPLCRNDLAGHARRQHGTTRPRALADGPRAITRPEGSRHQPCRRLRLRSCCGYKRERNKFRRIKTWSAALSFVQAKSIVGSDLAAMLGL